MSGCGWCIHPQRRVTTDLKIMVRRGELACRDGWSRDLWAPAGEMFSLNTPVPQMTGPVEPVSPEEMTQLVSARYITLESVAKNQPERPVDVVVGETPALPANEDRATLLSHDPRAAIEAARKRHLAILQADAEDAVETQTPLNRSGDYSAVRSPFVSSTLSDRSEPKEVVPPRPVLPRRAPEVAPVGRDEVPRDNAGLVSFKGDEEQFSSVPEVADGIQLPRRGDERRIPLVAGESFEHDVEIAPTRVKSPSRWPLDREKTRTDVTAFTSELEIHKEEPVAFDEPIAAEAHLEHELALEAPIEDEWAAEAERDYDEAEHYHDPPPQRKRWQPSFRFERPSRHRRHEESVESWEDDYEDVYAEYAEDELIDTQATEPDYLRPDPAFAWQEVDDRIDMTIEASPTVPRVCRTCRDFRPADNGGRGWCTNKWAFSHRRMVDEDELPCETSLGCWWLPHDEVWLAEADAASHTEPTPLVDHWIGRRIGANAATGTRRR